MELNYILTWLVAASCLLQGFVIWSQARLRHPEWFYILGAVLAVLGITSVLWPGHGGIVAAPLWAVFVLGPSLGNALIRRLLARFKYRAAERIGRALSVVHPFGITRVLWRWCRALADLEDDRAERALEGLRELEPLADERGQRAQIGASARVMRLRLEREHEALIDWLDRQPPGSPLRRSNAVHYLRSLGELGEVDEMCEAYARRKPTPIADPRALAIVRLVVLAYSGRVDGARALLDGPLAWMDPGSRALALGTAEQVAGDRAAANERLEDALEDPACKRRHVFIRQRLEHPLDTVDRSALRPGSQTVLAMLEEEARRAAAEGPVEKLTRAPSTPATWAVCALLTVVFLAEIPGGTTNLENLYDMGMLVLPLELADGQWWRFATAGLLHYGPLHFLLNTLALYFFGRTIERIWGRWPFILTFFASNFAGVAAVALFTEATAEDPVTLVGASGGVMGVLGALTAIVWRMWQIKRTRAIQSQLMVLVLVLAVQIVFDAMTPIVSQQAHLGGMAVGLALGWLMGRPKRRPKRSGSTA